MSGREASGATVAAAEVAAPAEAAPNDDAPAAAEAASNVADLSNPQDDDGGGSGGGGGLGDEDAATVVHAAPTGQVWHKPLRASPLLRQHILNFIREGDGLNDMQFRTVLVPARRETQSTS